jgi:hypothetical protein
MKRPVQFSLLALVLPLGVAVAQNNSNFQATLSGSNEVPALSTGASGAFNVRISKDDAAIAFELSYDGLEGSVTAAHIHLGQRDVNGGVIAFLCSAAGTPQTCPAPPAQISGVITAADVIGPTGQGIDAGEFAEMVRAIRNGTAYVNVHSTKFPGGEIRAQITPGNNE